MARTREVEGFRSSVRDLAARIDASLGGAAASDRPGPSPRARPADAIGETLTAASDAVDRYLDEARALRAPSPATSISATTSSPELERAGRALATVEHGATIIVDGPTAARRELEAQTSIKRGYLNLLHAREAIAREASRARTVWRHDAATTPCSGILGRHHNT